jgi:hypothetical protein
MYFADLSPCYFGFGRSERLKAVGWLAWGHPYRERQAELREDNFRQLLRLLRQPWEPGHLMGRHECEFCFGNEEATLERYGFVIYFAASNLFVPGKGCIYVAPSMIAHYIDKHRYEPPSEFWQAVLDCPDMQSDGYKEALLANGPTNEKWVRKVSDTWPIWKSG